MAKLKQYTLEGSQKGDVELEDALLQYKANPQMIKDYIVAIRANRRQWSASTQTRSEVSHSKKKPFAQKGTGNARQGFLGAAQFRGGGRVHAPRPKFNQHTRINRKERQLAIRSLLTEKIENHSTCVLAAEAMSAPKTKTLAQFLKQIQFEGKRTLFLADRDNAEHQNLSKSLSNLPKVSFQYLKDVNGYDLAITNQIVFLDGAVEELKAVLKGGQDAN